MRSFFFEDKHKEVEANKRWRNDIGRENNAPKEPAQDSSTKKSLPLWRANSFSISRR
jgi:hypothetical protein